MAFSQFIGFFLVAVTAGLLTPSLAYKHYVGGNDGWVSKPSEDYNHWAGRNRFQVNDTLYFKYDKGSDSVLVVTKDDYNSCNGKSPIQRFDNGETSFIFDRSGPFFFISGNVDHCQKGQKLIVVVMAVRHKQKSPPPPTPATPATPPASPTPGAPAPSQNPSGTNVTGSPPRGVSSAASASVTFVLGFFSLVFFMCLV